MCSSTGQDAIRHDIAEFGLNRVVVASCSPRLHESTFRAALAEAGLNPYLQLQDTMRRMPLLGRLLADLGIEPARFRLEWVSAAEGARWARVVSEMTEQVKKLGPLDWEAATR